MKRSSVILLGSLLALLFGCTTATTTTDRPELSRERDRPMTALPPAGIDVVEHNLTIEVLHVVPGSSGRLPEPCQEARDVGADSRVVDTIEFGGRMLLRRDSPVRMEDGRFRERFFVLAWSANGYSKLLNTAIQYVLSPDVEQPESSITSDRPGQQLPATLEFNLIFDAYANGRLVKRRHHGRPRGSGFLVIPPNGNRALSPTITEFENCYVDVPDPRNDRNLYRFRPRKCNDEEGNTIVTIASQ